MEKKYSTFGLAKRRNFVWLAVLFAAASMAMRITYYSIPFEGAESLKTTWQIISLIVVPCIVCVWFCYALIRHSHMRLYKTASPLLLWLIFAITEICCYSLSGWQSAIAIAAAIVFALIYRFTVNPGGIKSRIPAAALGMMLFAAHLFYCSNELKDAGNGFAWLLLEFSAMSILVAYEIVLLNMKKYESDRPFPMIGDRPDGRRLRSLDPMTGVAVYIMPDRNGANNLFKDCFECSNAEKYIRQKRDEGLEHFGYTHLILASYVRIVSQRPAVNRFISGQKIYSRGHDVEVSMAIKKKMATDGSETIINIHFDVNDSVEDVYRKFNEQVESVKATEELDSSFDRVAGLLNLIPGVLMKFTVWVLKTMDYFGLLPKFLLEISPFHASGFITSMGSLGIPPIYHHLYDFGNIPIFVAFGMKRRNYELTPEGEIEQKKYIDFSIVTDERICDGFYFASAFKLMKRYLNHPEKLDEKHETIVEDVY